MFKKISSILSTLLIVVMLLVAGLVVTYRTHGIGIGFDQNKAVISIRGKVNTLSSASIEETINTEEIRHKRFDSYNDLTVNEKAVYNALLAKNIDILENNDNLLKLNVSLKDFDFNLTGDETYPEAKEKIIKAFDEINLNNVFASLQKDYTYYYWHLYNSKFVFTEPYLVFENNDISNSYFTIELQSLYARGEVLDIEGLELARNSYSKAKSIAESVEDKTDMEKINYFFNYILENTNYYDDYVDNNDGKQLWSNFISVFDDNEDTLSICGGYADAFQLLCDLSGIECYKAVGYMNELHAWNEVIIDDQTYLVDLTNSEKGTVGYNKKLFMKPVSGDEYSINVYGDNIHYKKISINEWKDAPKYIEN